MQSLRAEEKITFGNCHLLYVHLSAVVPVGNVLRQGPVEQDWLLGDDTQLGSDPTKVTGNRSKRTHSNKYTVRRVPPPYRHIHHYPPLEHPTTRQVPLYFTHTSCESNTLTCTTFLQTKHATPPTQSNPRVKCVSLPYHCQFCVQHRLLILQRITL